MHKKMCEPTPLPKPKEDHTLKCMVCLFVYGNDSKGREPATSEDSHHAQMLAELALQSYAFIACNIAVRVSHLGSFCEVGLGLLPVQAFTRQPGFLPQFKDMHISLAGGSFEFEKW